MKQDTNTQTGASTLPLLCYAEKMLDFIRQTRVYKGLKISHKEIILEICGVKEKKFFGNERNDTFYTK